MKKIVLVALPLAVLAAQLHGAEPPRVDVVPPIGTMTLKGAAVPGPAPAILAEYVKDKTVAIQLGKALFWESRVGSDNKQACASCHFSAGADNRSRNELSPGLLRRNADLTPNPDSTFQVGGPNYQLAAADLPLTRFASKFTNDPAQRTQVNDNISSQGVFNGTFNSVDTQGRNPDPDDCTYTLDPDGFHKGSVNSRRVPPRNTPSVINAVFNFRNFWDGRANNMSNGGDPFGLRNPNALVWKLDHGELTQIQVAIPTASLASQSSGPPLSGTEMSCGGRTFVHIGQKLLDQPILANQTIAPDDSVLGALARTRPTYRQLVQKAFTPQYWQAPSVVFGKADADHFASMDIDDPKHKRNHEHRDEQLNIDQMAANFALFFSLSIQLYESTLIADDSKLDRYAAGDLTSLNDTEQFGLSLFRGKGKCVSCHGGPELTNASYRNVIGQRLETMKTADGSIRTYDTGFYNIGVRPTLDDLGIGGSDPWGNPLSESMLLAEAVDKYAMAATLGNDFDPSKYSLPYWEQEVNAAGAFKVPGLRNVELTAPYFHNGGKATLMQVVDFYNRGGDFGRDNIANLAPDIQPIGFSEAEKTALVSFLLALTDERVRMEKAPFDHPSLCIPNGHDESSFSSSQTNATDDMLCLDAVGAGGRATPIPVFLGLSPYSH